MLQASRFKIVALLLIIIFSCLSVLPNFLSPILRSQWLVPSRLSLGLDLQGGSAFTFRIERGDLIRARLDDLMADIANGLKAGGIAFSALEQHDNVVTVTVSDPARVAAARQSLGGLAGPVVMDGQTVEDFKLSDGADGRLIFTLTGEGLKAELARAMRRSIEVVYKRLGEMGFHSAKIVSVADDRLFVEVTGLSEPQRLKSILNQQAKLTFQLLDNSMPVVDAIRDGVPKNADILYGQEDQPVPYLVDKQVLLTGADLVDARAERLAGSGEPAVTFRFSGAAAKKFEALTAQNIGRTLAIVLDHQVLSAPVIREAITGASGQISGSFTPEGAHDLAILLRGGALPANLTVVEERTVWPSLGTEAIQAGLIAAIMAGLLVVALMVGFYGFFGVLAVFGLIINLMLIMAALSLSGAVLTLAGIAGIVLIIGLGLDANVLLYERIREEHKAGKPLVAAIETGLKRGTGTIIDANITTFIVAVLLFALGRGPVQGFALSLAIGVVTTVFVAFTVTRWLFALWVTRRLPLHMPKGVRTHIFDETNIPFMAARRGVFIISAVLCFAAVVGFTTTGVKLGVDFSGGSIVEMTAREGNVDLHTIQAVIEDLNIGSVALRAFDDGKSVALRVSTQDAGDNGEQSAVAKLRDAFENKYEFKRTEIIGPDLARKQARVATLAMLASLLAIFIYIMLRFQWQFAIGALVATVHDVVLVLGLFVLSGIEFDLYSIAGILTMIGYSLNDTVVVYDRMRENLRRFPKMPIDVLIDTSINQTLSRTILTAVTTGLALLALLVFGSDVIRPFSFLMLFGVLVGTFSSIYIAAPVLIAFRLRAKTADNVSSD